MPDTHEFETKRLARPFTPTIAEGEEGTFEGTAAVFGELHPTSSWSLPMDYMDTIAPGAFKKTLAEHKKRGTRPAMLLGHMRGAVIGRWLSVEETEDGLQVKGLIATKTALGKDTHELLKVGALDALSIGFRVVKSELDDKAKVRTITQVELGEISVVDIPGIATARVTDVKSARGAAEFKRSIEEFLRDAGMSREEAKAFVSAGWKETHPEALRDAAAKDEGEVAAALKRAAAILRP